jgi:hypothetical protein
MDLQRVGTDPEAAAGGQLRGLGDLGEAEDADPEGAGRVLTAGRDGELYVVKGKAEGGSVIGAIAKWGVSDHAATLRSGHAGEVHTTVDVDP